jgi:hypothetical protein
MSKYILRNRTSGFTTVSNNVIHALKSNLPALGLYLYLLSLPDNWEFYKTQIAKECSMGINKLDKLLKVLSSFELVQYGQKRSITGQFENFYIDIYDIESIKINKLQNQKNEPVQPVYENRATVTVAPSQSAIKETIQNKKEKTNISCSSESDERNLFFDKFWKIYPRKQKKKESKKTWKKIDDKIMPLILEDVKKRYDLYWRFKQKEYIPLPTTYLNGCLWEDEIIIPATNDKIIPKVNEIKSTIPWFGDNH